MHAIPVSRIFFFLSFPQIFVDIEPTDFGAKFQIAIISWKFENQPNDFLKILHILRLLTGKPTFDTKIMFSVSWNEINWEISSTFCGLRKPEILRWLKLESNFHFPHIFTKATNIVHTVNMYSFGLILWRWEGLKKILRFNHLYVLTLLALL